MLVKKEKVPKRHYKDSNVRAVAIFCDTFLNLGHLFQYSFKKISIMSGNINHKIYTFPILYGTFLERFLKNQYEISVLVGLCIFMLREYKFKTIHFPLALPIGTV